MQYMVEFDLPEFDAEMLALIPEQRQKINELLERGIIQSYSLSIDRQKLWVIMKAKNAKDLRAIIGTFPMVDFMVPSIFELMFSNSATAVPTFSLN